MSDHLPHDPPTGVPAVIAVETAGDGMRLDCFLAAEDCRFPAKKSAYKAVKRGEVAVNGQRILDPRRLVRAGDQVAVYPDLRPPPPPLRIDMRVVWEDDVMAIVEKPPGLPVSGNFSRTVLRALPHNLRPSPAADRLRSPQPVHRLDSATGGLLVVAKSAQALMNLGRQFQSRRVGKFYQAVAAGPLPEQIVVDLPLDGRSARTEFSLIDAVPSLNYQILSLVECRPLTGRTHQIRRHLAHLKAPVVGDAIHGTPGRILKGKGLFLWAVRLVMNHPLTGEPLDVRIDPPKKFAALLARERRRSPPA